MIRLNRVWIVCAGVLALAGTQRVRAADGVLEFKVKGVVCAMCVQSIRKRVETLPEVHGVEIDLQRGTVRVTPLPDKVLDREAVVQEIEKSGYDISEELELRRSKDNKGQEQ